MTIYRFKNYYNDILRLNEPQELENTLLFLKQEPATHKRNLLIELIEVRIKILREFLNK
jgi:hypothetical protein